MHQAMNYIMNIMHLERDLKRLTTDWATTTGLSLNELRILVYVEQHPDVQIGDVAVALNVAKASLAQNIGTLIQRDWLQSEPIQEDRRLRVLTLTSNGRQQMQAIDEQLAQSLSSQSAERLAKQLATFQTEVTD